MDELLLNIREKRLFASLYLFVCRFVSVAPISRISLKTYIEDFHENLLGKPSFVKIGPKLLRTEIADFSVLQCTWRHYFAIKSLSSR